MEIDGKSKPARCFVGLKLRPLDEVADRPAPREKPASNDDVFFTGNNQTDLSFADDGEGDPF